MPNHSSNAPPRKRAVRYNTPGDSHFLTFSCYRRQPFLSRERTCQWLADAICVARERHSFRLIAYVFMPEHVHLLIRPMRDQYDISKILHAIKHPVSRVSRTFVLASAPHFIPRMRISASGAPLELRFWQAGGGYDRNVYSVKELWEKIYYIHGNPVRRKLVTQAVDWKWSSAADYGNVCAGPLAVDNDNLPTLAHWERW